MKTVDEKINELLEARFGTFDDNNIIGDMAVAPCSVDGKLLTSFNIKIKEVRREIIKVLNNDNIKYRFKLDDLLGDGIEVKI